MSLRQIATAASTFVVAIVLALAVPVSQLRTITAATACCCPDPDRCKCPDHDKHAPTQTTMKTCHNPSQGFVAPPSMTFVAASVELAAVTRVIAPSSSFTLVEPHSAPAPRRPDAPS